MPATAFNNMLAQSPDGKQKRSIIGLIDPGIFVWGFGFGLISGLGFNWGLIRGFN